MELSARIMNPGVMCNDRYAVLGDTDIKLNLVYTVLYGFGKTL